MLRGRAVWSVADQVISSISNFIVLLLVIRVSDAAGVGAFSLLYAGFFLTLSFTRGLAMDPFVVEHSEEDPQGGHSDKWRREAGRALGASAVIALAIGVCVSVVGALVPFELGVELIVFGIALVGLLIQDSYRAALFGGGRPQAAFANDSLFLTVQVLAIAAVAFWADLTVASVLISWGLGAFAGVAFGVTQFRAFPVVSGALSWTRYNIQLGRAFTADYLANRGLEQATLSMISVFGGLGALGLVSTARTLFAPMTTLQTGISSFALPEVSRKARTLGHERAIRKFIWTLAVSLSAGMGVAGLIIYSVPSEIGERLIGPNWSAAASLVLPMTAFSAVNAAGFTLWLGLRALRLAKEVFIIRVATGVLGLGAASLGAQFGAAAGAIWGMTVGVLTQLMWLAVVFERELNRRQGDVSPSMLEGKR